MPRRTPVISTREKSFPGPPNRIHVNYSVAMSKNMADGSPPGSKHDLGDPFLYLAEPAIEVTEKAVKLLQPGK